MKIKFSSFVALAATLVAGCAAYYSVFGLSQLFAGASLAVIIMASSLEFSKIIAVSLLQRYWDKIKVGLKVYLLVGVFILVCITSAGIYGFLSNAYQKTAHKLEISESEVKVLTTKKDLFQKSINDNQSIVDSKKTRLSQLGNLRTNQETRLDGANSKSDKRTARADIDAASKEIQKLNSEIDILSSKNSQLSDSVNLYSKKAIELQSNDSAVSEIGPLKYLAQLTGYPMDKIINWFILLLIFVFDPLAVALVFATNKILEIESQSNEVTPEPIKPKKLKHKPELELEPEPEPEIEAELEPEIEPEPEVEPEPEIEPEVEALGPIIEPVITTGKIELNDIKEKKEQTNRGFSQSIPNPNRNTIQRIANKYR